MKDFLIKRIKCKCKKPLLDDLGVCINCGANAKLEDSEIYAPLSKRILVKGGSVKYVFYHELMTNKERAILPAIKGMQLINELLGLPNYCIKQGVNYLERLYEKGFTRGRDKSLLVTALLFIVARNNDVPRTMQDFEEAGGFASKKINRCVKEVKNTLGLSLLAQNTEALLERFAYELNISFPELVKAKKILPLIRNKSPRTTVSLALLKACGELSISEVSRVTGTHKVTLERAKA